MIRNSSRQLDNNDNNFQDLVAKVKNLVTLAPVLGAILRPDLRTKMLLKCLEAKPSNKQFITLFT